jgi:alpha-glucosidase
MFETGDVKVLFTEAALQSYPGMFLEVTKTELMKAIHPKYVLKAIPNEESSPDRNQILKEKANYIAKVSGNRKYPWRVFMISDDDRTFVESNLVTKLSDPSKIADASWIKPGQVAWDWYNANNIYDVDFESGINTETYKYYIDFASKNGIEYIILDEGWTKSTTEILESNENLDLSTENRKMLTSYFGYCENHLTKTWRTFLSCIVAGELKESRSILCSGVTSIWLNLLKK